MPKKAKKKKQGGELSEELKTSAHRIWLAGLGAMAVAEEEGSKLFKRLVERGESYEGKGREELERLREAVEEAAESAKKTADEARGSLESQIDRRVTAVLERIGVPTRDEVAELTQRVEDLTKAVKKLDVAGSAGGRNPTGKKAPAKKAKKKATEAKS